MSETGKPLTKEQKQELKERISVADAMNRLIIAINEEQDYAWGWFANLTMAFHDMGCAKDISDKGAQNFMQIAFEMSTQTFNKLKEAYSK